MAKQANSGLSRRERQIMDIIYAIGQATAADILERLPDPPSNSTVRTLCRLLEDKGHLKHAQDGPRYVYSPCVPRKRASQSALKHMLETFFDGSPENVVTALLDIEKANLSTTELRRMREAIARAEREGR